MLISEFQILTGIYPDAALYSEIEREYHDGDWQDKHDFCTAYKANHDGLAERIQSAANQRLLEHENRLIEKDREIRRLRYELEEIEEHHEQATALCILKSHMLDALREMAHDEFERDQIGDAVIAFDYLLREEGSR